MTSKLDTAGLVERLRAKRMRVHDLSGVGWEDDPDCIAAADLIEALTQAAAPERRAPVQGYKQGIPWSLHCEAWDVYAKKYGRGQSAERLAERGGFGTGELDMFLPGWRERVSEIAELRGQLSALQERAERADRERDELLYLQSEIETGDRIMQQRLEAAEARVAEQDVTVRAILHDAETVMQAHDPGALNMSGDEAMRRLLAFVRDAAPAIEAIANRARAALAHKGEGR